MLHCHTHKTNEREKISKQSLESDLTIRSKPSTENPVLNLLDIEIYANHSGAHVTNFSIVVIFITIMTKGHYYYVKERKVYLHSRNPRRHSCRGFWFSFSGSVRCCWFCYLLCSSCTTSSGSAATTTSSPTPAGLGTS